jgi:plastocyanin
MPGVNFTATAGAQAVQCPASGTTDVTIQDNFFAPNSPTISANGIVKWTNNGPSVHTVTSGTDSGPTPDGKFDSGDLGTSGTSATFCVQFFITGPHPYYCKHHPGMIGLVTVQ